MFYDSPCTIFVCQALTEALTTSKGMVGRRLLSCSDLSKKVNFGFKKITIGFSGPCNEIVDALKATWDKAKKVAVDAVNLAATVAADLAKAAADLADVFMGEVRKLGDQIQCAAPLPPQRGEPRCGGDNGPAHFPGRSGILAQCADMEPGATWQECLRCSGGSGQRHCGVCHEVI